MHSNIVRGANALYEFCITHRLPLVEEWCLWQHILLNSFKFLQRPLVYSCCLNSVLQMLRLESNSNICIRYRYCMRHLSRFIMIPSVLQRLPDASANVFFFTWMHVVTDCYLCFYRPLCFILTNWLSSVLLTGFRLWVSMFMHNVYVYLSLYVALFIFLEENRLWKIIYICECRPCCMRHVYRLLRLFSVLQRLPLEIN
jgi:hypothetical protein